MRRTLFLTLFLLVLGARPAYGEGINLAWADCLGSPRSATDQTFSCDTDVRVFTLVGSFFPPGGIGQLTAIDGVVELTSARTGLSDWWQLDTFGCRGGSLNVGFEFAGLTGCQKPWGGQVLGLGQYYTDAEAGVSRGPHLRFFSAALQSGPVSAGREYYALQIAIDAQRTVGGACDGCGEGMCVTLASLRLYQSTGDGAYVITRPATRNCVTWQGGSSSCPAACGEPNRRNSWGQLKNLYR